MSMTDKVDCFLHYLQTKNFEYLEDLKRFNNIKKQNEYAPYCKRFYDSMLRDIALKQRTTPLLIG